MSLNIFDKFAPGKLKNENANFDVTMFIPNDKENFKNAINLIDTKTNENEKRKRNNTSKSSNNNNGTINTIRNRNISK